MTVVVVVLNFCLVDDVVDPMVDCVVHSLGTICLWLAVNEVESVL